MPILRHASATTMPSSTCLSTATICSTEKRPRLTTSPAPLDRGRIAERLTLSVSRFLQCGSPRDADPHCDEEDEEPRGARIRRELHAGFGLCGLTFELRAIAGVALGLRRE